MELVSEDLFFYMSIISSVGVGLVILTIISISKISGVGLGSMDYDAVGVALFLVLLSVALLWLRKKFFEGLEEKEKFK